ncbi:MAG: CBS domain-containing protein [Planctomycetes bacterium]|nr:CBS domain-containing protein [Planctomycetota bacterium]
MATVATDITTCVAGWSDGGFEAFCDDIAGMFGVDMQCERRQAAVAPIRSLRERFKKLTAVHVVRAEGTLEGTFHLLLDQAGLFILGGVIVMLPEPRILEGIKQGSLRDAESLQDAAREAGNLLVGSWDRVFRQDCQGHKHFLKTDTFIGKPWDNSGLADLQTDEEALIVTYEMTIEPYPSFTCAAVFPKAVFAGRGDRETVFAAQPGPAAGSPESPGGGAKRPVVRESAPEAPCTAQEETRRLVEERSPSIPAPSIPASDSMFLDPAYVLAQPRSEPPEGAGRKPATDDRAAPLPAAAPAAGLTELLATPAAQIMQKEVVWADPEDTVQDVIARMQQHNIGYVLVGRDGKLEGLVSSSNILGAVSVYLRPMFAKWRRPEDDATLGVKVKWIMSRPVRTVRPEATVAMLIESMRRCGGRCLPVAATDGTVCGLVTVFDILLRLLAADKSFAWQGQPPQAPALLL